MSTTTRWTSADLALMPDDGTRYEIIDGELHMSKQPRVGHQGACFMVCFELEQWNRSAKWGRVIPAPGLIFGDDDDVSPDAVLISNERYAIALGTDGKLHSAPESVIEVLSPGSTNERRDREAKLDLYSRRGVTEYWILNWRNHQIEVYRRDRDGLEYAMTLSDPDTLASPLLPGFACSVASLFQQIDTGQ